MHFLFGALSIAVSINCISINFISSSVVVKFSCMQSLLFILLKYLAMEIQECSLPGFYCSRILGLAPYLIKRVKRHNKNRIEEIQWSLWLCFYSICFMTATGKATNHKYTIPNVGIFIHFHKINKIFCPNIFKSVWLCDFYSSMQIQKHQFGKPLFTPLNCALNDFILRKKKKCVVNRMRTATSRFVTVFNVCVVVSACLCGAITGLIGQKFTQKINSNLNKVSIRRRDYNFLPNCNSAIL